MAKSCVGIGVRLGIVFNKCDSSRVSLFFIDVLMSGFGKSVGNLVNNLWFTVNSNSISRIKLTWSVAPFDGTAAIVVNFLVSQILILKGNNYLEALNRHSLLVPYNLNFLESN